MQMKKDFLASVIVIVLFLMSGSTVLADANETELWKTEAFMKKVEAIKKQNWNEISTRDVALLQFAEINRLAEKMESRLTSLVERVYELAIIVGVALGAYFILQLLLMLVLVLRVGQLAGKRSFPERYS